MLGGGGKPLSTTLVRLLRWMGAEKGLSTVFLGFKLGSPCRKNLQLIERFDLLINTFCCMLSTKFLMTVNVAG